MIGIIIFSSIAFILSILLVVADHVINSKRNIEDDIVKLLPGYNCGACGFSGCPGMAKAILSDKEAYKKCRPLKEDRRKELEEFIKNNL